MSQGKNIHDEIAKVAYKLFENGGRMKGCELENWLVAEKIVMERCELENWLATEKIVKEKHTARIEQDANFVGSTKEKKASGKAEPKTLKKSKKTSESSSQTRTEKNPPRKKTK